MDKELDMNLLIQTFSEKITQLTNDCVVKDTIIKQLSSKIEELELKIKKENENDE